MAGASLNWLSRPTDCQVGNPCSSDLTKAFLRHDNEWCHFNTVSTVYVLLFDLDTFQQLLHETWLFKRWSCILFVIHFSPMIHLNPCKPLGRISINMAAVRFFGNVSEWWKSMLFARASMGPPEGQHEISGDGIVLSKLRFGQFHSNLSYSLYVTFKANAVLKLRRG